MDELLLVAKYKIENNKKYQEIKGKPKHSILSAIIKDEYLYVVYKKNVEKTEPITGMVISTSIKKRRKK